MPEPRQLITQTVECLEQKRYFLQNYVVLLYLNLAHKFDFYSQPDNLLHILKGPGDSCHWPKVAIAQNCQGETLVCHCKDVGIKEVMSSFNCFNFGRS